MVLITTTMIRLTVSDPKGSTGGRWQEKTKQNTKTRGKEELLNTQGCTNTEGTALGERELPVTRGDQAEKVDMALAE